MIESNGSEAGREGLFAALKSSIATVIAIVKTRVELLITELEEEKFRLMALWSKAIGAAFCVAVGLIMAVFCLALAFWEHRVFVFGLFAVLFLAVGFVLIASLKKDAAKGSRMFHASLAELEEDMAQLRRKVHRPE